MQPQDFHVIIDNIERALFTFESTANHALLRIYRDSNFASSSSNSVSSAPANHPSANIEQENVFIIYLSVQHFDGGDGRSEAFFSIMFTLQEFAGELICLTDAMRRIYAVELNRFSKRRWWQRYMVDGPKSMFSLLRSFRRRSISEKHRQAGLRRLCKTNYPCDPPNTFISGTALYFSAHRHPKVSFPKVRPHAPNTVQTPDRSNLGFIGRLKRFIWDLGDKLKDRNIKYAFKVGMSTAILAAPAFIDATRPIFNEYRGEWALVSVGFHLGFVRPELKKCLSSSW